MAIVMFGKENKASNIRENRVLVRRDAKVICMMNIKEKKGRSEAIAEIKKEASYLKW